jgi:uncharacterized YccA/Bax inhibitor family protein
MTHSTMLRAWNTIRQRIMRFPSAAAEHAFPFTLLLIAAAGVFALVLFYVYGFSSQTKRIEQGVSLYDVREELFLDTIGVLEEQERNLENASSEASRDIFNPD